MRHLYYILTFVLAITISSCEEAVEHTAGAIHDRDSVAVMTTWGVNTLISDSGVIKYRIVTERWEVNQNKRPSRWIFDKGLFLTQFDEKFHIRAYIQCDTAFYYDQQRIWELRSRVRVLTKDGLRFRSEQLFWDQNKHEFYSNLYSHLVTPERTLEGSYFRSDEKMTRYYVSNSKGSFERGDFDGSSDVPDTVHAKQDSVQKSQRQQAIPQRSSNQNPL